MGAQSQLNEDEELNDDDNELDLGQDSSQDDSKGQEEDHEEDHEDDSHEDDEDDSRLKGEDSEEADGEGDGEDETELRRQQNRARRQDKKRRAREREEGYQRELASRDQVIAELSNRLNAFERRSQGVDLAQIDQAMQQLNQNYNQAQQALKEASEANNGQIVVEATERMFQIRQRFDQLARVKNAVQQQAARPQPLDPRLIMNAQTWMNQNRWYKPEGSDLDSRRVRRIDQDLAEEGMLPTEPDYWRELTNRVKKELPHRFQPVYNESTGSQQKLKKRQPVGSSGSNDRSEPARGVKLGSLSKERVNAMKEAGIWQDPKARALAIKEYQSYDKSEQT